MEAKRVLLNKRFLMTFVVLLITNVALYYGKQSGELSRMERQVEQQLDLRDVASSLERLDVLQQRDSVMIQLFDFKSIREEEPERYAKNYAILEERVREEYPELAKEYDANEQNGNSRDVELLWNARNRIQERLSYIMDYPKRYEKMRQQQAKLSKFSIFSKENTFSSNNINKTIADYGRLEGIPLQYVNEEGIRSIVEYTPVHFLLFALAMGILLSFFEERKKGLWALVYSTKYGRMRLAVKRAGILFVGILIGVAALYGSLALASAFVYGTFHDWDAYTASMPFLSDFTWPMPIWAFLLSFLLLQACSMYATALFLWFTLSLIRNRNLALFALVGVYALGYLLYRFLPIQSNVAILKYVNAFHYLNLTETLTGYHNLPILHLAVGRMEWSILFLLVAGILFLVGDLWLAHRSKPIQRMGWLEKKGTQLFDWIRGITSHLTLTLMELYKLIWVQKGWMVLIVLLWLCYDGLEFTEMIFAPRQEFLDEFYQEMEGPVGERATAYIEDLRLDVENFYNAYSEMEEEVKRGNISKEEWESMQYKEEYYNDYYRMGLTAMQEKLHYIEELEREKGIKGWLVNERGYEVLLGNEGYKSHVTFALKGFLCLIVILSDIFSYEYRTGVKYTLSIAKKGRGVLYRRKTVAACLLATIIWAAISITEWIGVDHYYALHCFGAPLQSLGIMRDIPLRIGIGQFLFLIYATRLMLLYAVTGVLCFLSSRIKRAEWTVLAGVVLLVPSLLYAMGNKGARHLAVVRYFGGTEVILEDENGLARYMAGVLVIALIGIAGYLLAGRKWCVTSSGTWERLYSKLTIRRVGHVRD